MTGIKDITKDDEENMTITKIILYPYIDKRPKTSEGRHWAVADNRIYSRAFSKLKDHGSFALGRRKKKETWLY